MAPDTIEIKSETWGLRWIISVDTWTKMLAACVLFHNWNPAGVTLPAGISPDDVLDAFGLRGQITDGQRFAFEYSYKGARLSDDDAKALARSVEGLAQEFTSITQELTELAGVLRELRIVIVWP